MESMEVPPAAVTAAVAAAMTSSGSGGGGRGPGTSSGVVGSAVDSDAMTALIEMGFGTTDARNALEAAGGDISTAVDILSSANAAAAGAR